MTGSKKARQRRRGKERAGLEDMCIYMLFVFVVKMKVRRYEYDQRQYRIASLLYFILSSKGFSIVPVVDYIAGSCFRGSKLK